MAALVCAVNMVVLPKFLAWNLTYGLYHHEFRCKCQRPECHYTIVNRVLLETYTKVRKGVGFTLEINSGFRCQVHNKEEGGIDESSHTTGNAVDISTKNLSADQKDKLIGWAQIYFDYVQIYDTFIHCQINPVETV